jgi:UDP-sugar pyrophosphorylase
MNSLAVPRKAKEAIGAITRLTKADGSGAMTVNVEYNQLDPLLRSTINKDGDLNDESGGSMLVHRHTVWVLLCCYFLATSTSWCCAQNQGFLLSRRLTPPCPAGWSPFPGNINQLVIKLSSQLCAAAAHLDTAEITTLSPCCPAGWSPFPGNINQLVIKLSSYVPQLAATCGNIGEFVNPKYKDASKTAFKSSTRLECMMQDYPKALPADAKVGFTVVNQVRSRLQQLGSAGCVYKEKYTYHTTSKVLLVCLQTEVCRRRVLHAALLTDAVC